jgi:hypothetical protein
MSTIVLRGSLVRRLTVAEVDANFNNLNNDKLEKNGGALVGGTINATTIGLSSPAAGTFTTLGATTLNATNLNVTGSVTLTSPLPLNQGGTNATSANQALTNLLPTDGEGAGNVLTMSAHGTYYWSAVSGGTSTNNLPTNYEVLAKNLNTYPYTINRSGDLITSVVYTTPSSGSITKTLNYSGIQLSSVTISGGPLTLSYTKTLNYSGSTITGASYAAA